MPSMLSGAMKEIYLDDDSSPGKTIEHAGTVSTDLAIAAEQAAMQAMYNFQSLPPKPNSAGCTPCPEPPHNAAA